MKQDSEATKTTNSKPIPHIPLPFKEVIADVLKVKPAKKKPKADNASGQKPHRRKGS
jgi:hypothetical protein